MADEGREALLQELRARALPSWFEDAKLGVLPHWGPSAVPAWAEPIGNFHEIAKAHGWEYWFRHDAYPEWYWNTIRIEGSPARAWHDATFGKNFEYPRFGPIFDEATRRFDPESWAKLFADAGVRYVVLVSKHHDGWTLWPSATPNPFIPGWHATRDLVGELGAAVRALGMRYGLYYSGGLDWTFEPGPVRDLPSLLKCIPQSDQYLAYANAHWRELIARYQPCVIWNDIGYPRAADLVELFADYYDAVPDGLVNDRFLFGSQPHLDFNTPEYSAIADISPRKWELTRGIGLAFGYNRNETAAHALSVRELVHLLCDVVSKNGNLLLGVGPMPDGTIPPLQRERLLGLGRWLAACGEAIYGTRPFQRAEGVTREGTPVRFTRKGGVLYALVLGPPADGAVEIEGLKIPPSARVTRLGQDDPQSPAFALRIEPAPAA
ncbi:MAG TPA: alpha-L-fucosidase [Deltaproteobacteria bacterium]|nr:alpha-L-fucosidase [Deltaproteobacteria bacterium]